MQFKDYYKIMNLDNSATTAEIKQAYRKLARRYHPDVSKENNAEQKFKEVGEAYDVLKDKDKRQEYDQLIAMGAMNKSGEFSPPPGWESATHFSEKNINPEDFSDFFSAIFGTNGGFHRHSQKPGSQSFSNQGEDIYYDLPLFLEDIFIGTEPVIEIREPRIDQRGLITHHSKKLKIKIPAGTEGGQHLRIKGQGAPGLGSGKPGDLIITIKLAPHPLYTISGRDITLITPVTPWEVALGEKITIPTLQGKIKVKVPPLSQSGKKLRLKGKGLTGSPAGDFFVVLKVIMPEHETSKSRELFADLAKEVPFNPRQHWE